VIELSEQTIIDQLVARLTQRGQRLYPAHDQQTNTARSSRYADLL
jgi:hypothetical protein